MDPSNINERIEKIMTHYSMSKLEFCKKIWMSEICLDEIFINQELPAFKLSRRICSEFPEISFTWLLLGNGTMLNSLVIKEQPSSQFRANTKHSSSLTIKQINDIKNDTPLDFGFSVNSEIKKEDFKDLRKVAKRIEKIMMFFSLSIEKFSEKVNIEQILLTNILEGMNKVTLDEIQLICSSFPQLNPRWLILGEGVFLTPTVNKEKLNNDELRITIRIAEEVYHHVIKRDEEEYYRFAAKSIIQNIKAYKIKHPDFATSRILKVLGYHYALVFARSKDTNDTIKFTTNLNKHDYVNAVRYLREKSNYYKVIFSDYSDQKIYGLIAYHFAFKSIMMKRND